MHIERPYSFCTFTQAHSRQTVQQNKCMSMQGFFFFFCRGADIRYLSEESKDWSLGESQRSFCQCHLSSRLGTKEVGASVCFPPSCAPYSVLHKRGNPLSDWSQSEASLNPQWGDKGRTSFFPGNRDLLLLLLYHYTEPPLCLSVSRCVSPLSSSALFHSPSWSCSVCTLARSGMRSYPLWLRHPQTHWLYSARTNIMHLTQAHAQKNKRSLLLHRVFLLPAGTQ